MPQPELDSPARVRVTLATWIYQLHLAGTDPDDGDLVSACAAVDAAEDRESGDAAGTLLVDRVGQLVPGEVGPGDVADLAARLYGDRARTDMGDGTRDERAARIRRYQFSTGLPWMARIYERHGDGAVRPTWLLVERVTGEVRAMDPDPWDDVDEERVLPWADFQVLWELDGCTSVHLD